MLFKKQAPLFILAACVISPVDSDAQRFATDKQDFRQEATLSLSTNTSSTEVLDTRATTIEIAPSTVETTTVITLPTAETIESVATVTEDSCESVSDVDQGFAVLDQACKVSGEKAAFASPSLAVTDTREKILLSSIGEVVKESEGQVPLSTVSSFCRADTTTSTPVSNASSGVARSSFAPVVARPAPTTPTGICIDLTSGFVPDPDPSTPVDIALRSISLCLSHHLGQGPITVNGVDGNLPMPASTPTTIQDRITILLGQRDLASGKNCTADCGYYRTSTLATAAGATNVLKVCGRTPSPDDTSKTGCSLVGLAPGNGPARPPGARPVTCVTSEYMAKECVDKLKDQLGGAELYKDQYFDERTIFQGINNGTAGGTVVDAEGNDVPVYCAQVIISTDKLNQFRGEFPLLLERFSELLNVLGESPVFACKSSQAADYWRQQIASSRNICNRESRAACFWFASVLGMGPNNCRDVRPAVVRGIQQL